MLAIPVGATGRWTTWGWIPGPAPAQDIGGGVIAGATSRSIPVSGFCSGCSVEHCPPTQTVSATKQPQIQQTVIGVDAIEVRPAAGLGGFRRRSEQSAAGELNLRIMISPQKTAHEMGQIDIDVLVRSATVGGELRAGSGGEQILE